MTYEEFKKLGGKKLKELENVYKTFDKGTKLKVINQSNYPSAGKPDELLYYVALVAEERKLVDFTPPKPKPKPKPKPEPKVVISMEETQPEADPVIDTPEEKPNSDLSWSVSKDAKEEG